MKKRCIFKANEKQGMEIFWFEPCESSDEKFNSEYVRVFNAKESEQPFIRLHISRIVELPDEVTTQKKMGRIFPSEDWMIKLQHQWLSDDTIQ